MRPHLLAALLIVPLGLAACDRNPVGDGVRAELVGDWESDPEPIDLPAPNGSHHVGYVDRLEFHADGVFEHSDLFVDLNTGRRWVVYEDKGRWQATESDLLQAILERFEMKPGQQIPSRPVLTRIEPESVHSGYRIEGATLQISPPCALLPLGIKADCVAPPPQHRVGGG